MAEVEFFQVQETFNEEMLEKMGVIKPKKSFAHIPVATIDSLAEADGIIFGVLTRFGMVPSQMQAFIERTGGLWSKGGLVNKVIAYSRIQQPSTADRNQSYWDSLQCYSTMAWS